MRPSTIGEIMLFGAFGGCGFSPVAAYDATIDPFDDAVLIDAPDGPPAACLTTPGYTVNAATGHAYHITTSVDFDDAVAACAAGGAHLAVIDNAAENLYVRSIANDVWIGLDDLTTEGTFRWVTPTALTFTAWAPGEPTDSNSNEDCVYLLSDTTPAWNDTYCGDHRAGVCECETGYTPPPTPACRSASGGKKVNGRLYFLHTSAKTWQAARDDCASNGAYLMVPSDDTEDQLVEDGGGLNAGANVWIGLNDLQTMGTWRWVDGSPFVYANWTTSAPYAGANQDCVILQQSDDKWANLSCSSNQKYVCECP